MKKINSMEVFEKLNQCELSKVKGGDERDYTIVIIDGKPTKVYI